MSYAPLALQGIGAATSFFGGMSSAQGTAEQGRAAQQAAYYNAQVALNNAAIADQQAARASFAGLQQAGQISLRGRANLGSIKASQAASGVDVNSGSALDTQVSAREANQLAAETTLNNAENVSYGYRVQAQSERSQAMLDAMGGDQAAKGGQTGAFGQMLSSTGGLLSTISSVGGKWNSLNPGLAE